MNRIAETLSLQKGRESGKVDCILASSGEVSGPVCCFWGGRVGFRGSMLFFWGISIFI